MTNTENLPSITQGDHGKWAAYVAGKRVSRFFDTRVEAIAYGIPAAFRMVGTYEFTPRDTTRQNARR